AVLIVDVPEASRIPALAEPFFLAFNATVKFRVVMTAEDLAKSGLETLGKKYPV
ncbi:MAG: panthothenate synthetase, partial [Dehalococcoidia bacterium]